MTQGKRSVKRKRRQNSNCTRIITGSLSRAPPSYSKANLRLTHTKSLLAGKHFFRSLSYMYAYSLRVSCWHSQLNIQTLNSVKLHLFDWAWQSIRTKLNPVVLVSVISEPIPLHWRKQTHCELTLIVCATKFLFEFDFVWLLNFNYGLSQIQFDWVQLKFCSFGFDWLCQGYFHESHLWVEWYE